jgi:hypothetical protein
MAPNKMVVMLMNDSNEIDPKHVIQELTSTDNKVSGGISSLGLVEHSNTSTQKLKMTDFGMNTYS